MSKKCLKIAIKLIKKSHIREGAIVKIADYEVWYIFLDRELRGPPLLKK